MPSLPKAMPNVKATIIACADPRVDPFEILGLTPGEAVVLRNIGGRVTPVLLEELGLLGRIGQVAAAKLAGGGEFHLIVLHHTDCGITRLVNDPDKLAHYFQIAEGDVPAKAVPDPRASVKVDVAALRAVPAFRRTGCSPGWCMTWRPGRLRWWCRRRRSGLPRGLGVGTPSPPPPGVDLG